MKKQFALLVSFVLAAGVALAQTSTPPKSTEKAAEKPAAAEKTAAPATTIAKTHEVKGDVVSADVKAKTLTLKTESGEVTANVEGKATASLSTLKAGQKVTVTCRDNEKGEHQAVTAIKLEKAAPAAQAPAKK